ncbi:PD-(D/E)XK motif protein [Mycobacterium sp. UM_Kg1]|uniref:PD-(D/E)XK motif protein n=1 Tax=Mycobacterium sp. UM_Kg1 TaxID=1545691 RepID=UPI00061B50A0|nr:PD-(D/E)XK motif protein [Mycobacterium sp. UM_Kg1]
MSDYQRLVVDRWPRIEREGVASPGGWRSMTLPVVAHGRKLIQAVDELGQHHLLIPADGTPHPENTRSPLAMSFRNFRFGSGGEAAAEGRYFDIHCQMPALNIQFDTVVGEVIATVENASRPIGAAAATLAAWRRLFTTLADVRPLTHQEKLAAFGELSVLQDLVVGFSDFHAASWTGPERQPHDFELADASIEVKSIGDDSESITVHGLEQLVSADGKPLYLIIRRVVEEPHGRTVPELLGEILTECDDPAVVRQRAARLGVYESMEDVTRFEVTESLIGKVDNGFPRITRDTLGPVLANVVSGLSYDLQLAAVRDQLTPGSVDKLQKRKW